MSNLAINARTIAPYTRAWLEMNTHARVIYVSAPVCYLVNDRDEIISINTDAIGKGPFALTVEEVDFSLHVDLETEALIAHERVRLGGMIIDCREAQLWNPRPAWNSLHLDWQVPDLNLIREVILAYAPEDSLASLVVALPSSRSVIDIELRQQAFHSAGKLTQGLEEQDLNLASQGVMGLAGLGGGLTPDGDDWILGSLLAIWTNKPESDAKQINDTLCRLAAERTTRISAAWLYAASRGECSAHWHELFKAFLDQDETRIRSSAIRIIQHGHTSGASAISGFVATLEGAGIKH